MRLSDVGLAHLKSFEGLRLEAYPDPGSADGLPITIGYGSTRTMGGAAWMIGDRITEAEAAQLLRRDAAVAEAAVNRLVQVPLTQAQYDALVSFAFNVGAGAFESSTLLRLLNAGDYAGAATQFDRWVHNDGKKLAGLVRRRAAEREMFESAPQTPQQIAASPQSIPVEAEPMDPFTATALSALVREIPGLIRSFGSEGRVTERNAKAAELLIGSVMEQTGAPNAQAAVDAVRSSPEVRAQVTQRLEAEGWFEITEAGGGGIEGARAYSTAMKGEDVRHIPAFWITIALLPLLYGTVWIVLTGSSEAFSGELRAAIASSVVTGILGGVIGYWLGLKFSAPRTQVLATGQQP